MIDARGTLYACVPYYIAEEYGFSVEKSQISYDRSDPNVLVMKISRPEVSHD